MSPTLEKLPDCEPILRKMIIVSVDEFLSGQELLNRSCQYEEVRINRIIDLLAVFIMAGPKTN